MSDTSHISEESKIMKKASVYHFFNKEYWGKNKRDLFYLMMAIVGASIAIYLLLSICVANKKSQETHKALQEALLLIQESNKVAHEGNEILQEYMSIPKEQTEAKQISLKNMQRLQKQTELLNKKTKEKLREINDK